MQRKKSTIIITVLTALFLCMGTTFASAASLSEIRDEIKEKEATLKEGKSKEKSLASQMVRLEGEINSMQESINQLDSAISEGEVKLVRLEEDLEEAESKVEIQNNNLGERLENMYKNGSVGFIDVLLDSKSFSEFLTNLDLVEKIYTSDKEMLSDLEEAYDEIESKKKKVESLQAELNESKAVAEEEKQNLETNQEKVKEQKKEIAASNEETQKMLDDLKADADRLTATIKNEGSSSEDSEYTGGEMAWPATASRIITSPFGWRIHPISGARSFHTGMDIGASYGTPIVAANPGTVISAGWNGGYGKCVIIDHGGGITTLYAHSSAIYVGVGQTVSRGQQIAAIGSTGNSTGPHLHFEVRTNGNYVNPYPYVT